MAGTTPAADAPKTKSLQQMAGDKAVDIGASIIPGGQILLGLLEEADETKGLLATIKSIIGGTVAPFFVGLLNSLVGMFAKKGGVQQTAEAYAKALEVKKSPDGKNPLPLEQQAPNVRQVGEIARQAFTQLPEGLLTPSQQEALENKLPEIVAAAVQSTAKQVSTAYLTSKEKEIPNAREAIAQNVLKATQQALDEIGVKADTIKKSPVLQARMGALADTIQEGFIKALESGSLAILAGKKVDTNTSPLRFTAVDLVEATSTANSLEMQRQTDKALELLDTFIRLEDNPALQEALKKERKTLNDNHLTVEKTEDGGYNFHPLGDAKAVVKRIEPPQKVASK